jgi:hypothetical protein
MSDGIGKYLKALGPAATSISSLTDIKRIEDLFFSVDATASNILKKFGASRSNVLAIKQSMTDAYKDVALMGGSFESIAGFQASISDTLNRNVTVNSEAYKEFYAMTEVTGQNLETITKNFKDAGYSIYQTSEQMQKVVDTARGLGLSVKAVSDGVVTNLDKMNKYNFQGGIEGLAKMASQSAVLRTNMSDMFQFAEKVYNPEGAIETAAALQRLGVTQAQLLDPLRLMNLSQNDPAELQNQVVQMTKSFVKMGESGNFEIMPGAKRRFQEIAKAMQIPYGELTKMALGSAELDDKMKKIKFPDADQFASKETRQLIANLAEKGKDGKYEITVTDDQGKAVKKSIAELSPKDIEKLKQPEKTMEEIQRGSLSALESIKASMKAMEDSIGMGIAGSKTSEDVLDAERKMYDKLSNTFTETFNVKEIRNNFDNGIQKMFDGILNDDTLGAFKDASNSLGNYLGSLADTFGKKGSENWDEFKNDSNKIIKVVKKLGGDLESLITDDIENMIKSIKKAAEDITKAATTTTTTTGSVTGAVKPIEDEKKDKKKAVANLKDEKKDNTKPVRQVEDFTFVSPPMQKIKFPDVPRLGELVSLPEDTLEIRGGTKTNQLLDREEKKNQINNSEGDIVMNISFNINIPSGGISKTDVETMLGQSNLLSEVKQKMNELAAPNGVLSQLKKKKIELNEKFRT